MLCVDNNIFYNSLYTRTKCILSIEQGTFNKRLKDKSEAVIYTFLSEYCTKRNKYCLTLNCRYETLIFYWETLVSNKIKKEEIKFNRLIDKKDRKVLFVSDIYSLMQLKKCFTMNEKAFNTLYRKMQLKNEGTYTNGYKESVHIMIKSLIKACQHAIHTQTGILLVWMY